MREILLTRLVGDNIEDKKYFEALGYQCIEQPLLQLSLSRITSELVMSMDCADWVFLTSQHSALFFLDVFLEHYPLEKLQQKKFAVIGKKTAGVLITAGLIPEFQSQVATKYEMFSEWLKVYSKSATIFYPKSNLADCLGEEQFSLQGHQLLTGILYDNLFSEEQSKALAQRLNEGSLEAVYFTSPSLWERFYSVYRKQAIKRELHFYCVGRTTQQAIQQSGYQATIK
ncbi:uroporphyrinogen-III synthase [Enterococcus sp. BWR-S5]|uniref:uroporphyrinogen-III synthase n=1 Tax=Enterococcus sp. BWR-S5 TaxID=2787714 RepID=UPI0019224470|nr:uroporphyrinogen-III synthase [Enterococcus sp. BWR-S5]MBL1224860.1 uroporphyrinogen-III synthase [Enterococcus sp. BWR-S5]